ncbi:MAG: hypothetical protein A3A12_01265 [Candidatus Staskawiczbacteria bacterium RIFCSPLOWO2_01_FULL_43_17b]|nr:MAG: hypothetical protein A3A12_01265 [Candidatus Staskawiczbacteria bacterium RIFCSPLOWO2_01_FULL_43_17b]
MLITRRQRFFISKGATLFLALLFLVSSVFPYPVMVAMAEEQDASATNTTTGADSTTISETNVTNSTEVTNQNDAVTYNNVYLKSETGNNNASYNTRSGVITTDRAEGRGEMVNLINNNVVNVEPTQTGNVSAGNENTGAGSDNQATVNITNETVIKNINSSNTVNQVKADVISGRNNSSANTGHGIILSGEANLGLNFMSLANTNFTGVKNLYADTQNIFGNHVGNIDFSRATTSTPQLAEALMSIANKNTGSGSTNTATVNIDNQTIISNSNNGKLNNQIQANVISGQNKANQNTGTGSIASGDVNSSVNVMNFLNANITASNFWLKSLNVFGDWSGNINLPQMPAPNLVVAPYTQTIAGENTTTGANSENEASVEVTNETVQTNDNIADITNDFLVKSNTGSNIASFNNGSGAVKYGDAKAETNTANVANVNITGDSWWILVVNKFGNWQGTTVGSPSDMMVNSGQNATVLSPVNSGIEVFNDTTGANSNNAAGASISHSNQLSNINDASITNNISVVAVSGENQAEYNVGHGYIEVGDVTSAINAMNIANVNVNVGNVLIAMVNVFGDWSGNIVFNSGASPLNMLGFPQSGTGSSSAFNQATGSGAVGSALNNYNSSVDINNQNTATNTNNSSATSSTGQNSANFNTGSGIVSTGTSDTGSSLLNQSNNNQVNVGAGGCGSGATGNGTTGSESENNTTTLNSCNLDIDNQNTTENNSNVLVNNSTGNNVASYNTGNGVVDTSWVDTFVQLYNQSNENQVTVGQVEAIVDSGTEDEATGGENNSDSSAGDTTGGDTDTESSIDANSGNENESGDGSTSDTGGTDQTGQDAQEETATTGSENTGNAGNGTSGQNNSTTQENSSSNNQGNQNTQNTQGNQNNQNSNNSNTQNGGAGTGAGGPSPAPASQQTPAVGTCSPTRPKGDINCDGKVDIYDLSVVMGNWSKRFKEKKADISGDGKVDFYDLSIIMGNWSKKVKKT